MGVEFWLCEKIWDTDIFIYNKDMNVVCLKETNQVNYGKLLDIYHLQQMGSLINNNNHISSPYRVLRGRINSVGFLPDERLIPYLELAGVGSTALIWTFDLRYDLISTLVERWRPETHTFHLPCEECTITLEDFTLQLGLPINWNVVTGISLISRSATLCYKLLGRSPSEGEFTS
ncbi:hypothetical protein J1N35_007719 [Gossypium stocksii]|uniref:Aminotransferase-like plant mobile domain-containing protein n=1 Tax=Gossypium stocksii TaxID=47602 RepID=A0A9D3W7S9_9ROSI|nr:hypothetical protein J1N35_007719 [Gossypium stocksii]